MQLGLLQFTAGKSHDVKDVLQLAVEADQLGYTRFWLGEHYTNIDWTNPEALLPIILGLTERIRVGTGGILLRLHSPFRIASTFKLMAAVFDDRLDLGVGAGITANEKGIKLMTNLGAEHFSQIDYHKQIEQLMHFFYNETALMAEGVTVAPIQVAPPPVWMLGSSYRSLPKALEYRCHFARSLFHQGAPVDPDQDILKRYRDEFYQKYQEKAQVTLAIAGVCAPSEMEAKGRFQESSYAHNTFIVPNLLGTPEQFAEMMYDLQNRYGVDEFVFLDMAEEQEHRLWSLEALAEVCQLTHAGSLV
jgi:luciferase family oxidoreductase group 1